MKKATLILLALLLCIAGAALADDKPTVTFKDAEGTINGGFDYELVIRVNKAQEEDLAVQVINNATGEVIGITIPAGETKAAALIPTQVVEKNASITFSFVQTDACNTGNRHTLNLRVLPKAEFYTAVNEARVGREMSVPVVCTTPHNLLRGHNVVTLKDRHGHVLAERKWDDPKERISFRFEVTQEMRGYLEMSVWLGDYCISEKTGYGAVAGDEDRAIVEMEPTLPIMAIGIDCGFGGHLIEKVLDVLAEHDTKVTFFVTGYFMRNFPESCKRMVAEGHEVANHSDTHKHLPAERTYVQYNQITAPVRLAEELLGVTPRLFRSPYGEYDGYTTAIATAEGMRMIMWGPTYHDSTGKFTEEEIFACATTGNDYRPGSVVLCHADGYYQPKTLDAGLKHYESLGLHVVPISAMLYYSGDKLPAMPYNHEALVYTDEYWATWIERERPDLLELEIPEHFRTEAE